MRKGVDAAAEDVGGNTSGKVSEGLGNWTALVFRFYPKPVLQLGSCCYSQRPLLIIRALGNQNPDSLHRGFLTCSRGSNGMWARSPFPCTQKTFSPRPQEQLMNSWESNLAHLKYYCIVHRNDGNNLVMSVHEASPVQNTQRVTHSLPVLSEYQEGLPFLSQGSHRWKRRWSLSSWHPGLWPWILRAVILRGYPFPSAGGFNAYGKYTTL